MSETPPPPGAPSRRPLDGRPRVPRPPGRSAERPVGRLGLHLTRFVTPIERTPPGRWIRSALRRACRMREMPIELARGRPELDGLRIAMLSDLHVGFFFSAEEFAALAERVSAWSPDLICLVGDLVDHEPEQIAMLRAGLARLRARDAVVAVPGNHEYAAERELKRFREAIEEAGAVPLWNRNLRIRRGAASLLVAGVDDLTGGDPDLAAALAGLDPEEPALLLSHHPDVFVEAAHVGVDLTLSGHTHGGQITWFGRARPSVHHTRYGYWHGLHERGGAKLLVGRGVGVCLLPVRVAAPAEVLLIELRVRAGTATPDC